MKLSKDFSLSEFEKSQVATRLGISNSVPEEYIPRIKSLTSNVLQSIRDIHGRVSISSGFRSATLNKAIGGSTKSQHSIGEAADFEVPGLDNLELAEWVRDNLQFDQLILEFYIEGEPSSGWVHVSYSEDNRNEVLTASKEGSKTIYKRGLPSLS